MAADLQPRRNRRGPSDRLHPHAPKPPATYSQAVKAAGLVFVSGTAPTDPATGGFKGTTIQEQTRQCLINIQAILEAAGSSLDKLVSVTVVMADEGDFAGMNEEWLRWFPSSPPARQGAQSADHPWLVDLHRSDCGKADLTSTLPILKAPFGS